MDKVIGRALLDGLIPLGERVLCVSGRLSFELVQKAAIAGAPILVGVGAPSSLAIELAADRGMTLCGFARGTGSTSTPGSSASGTAERAPGGRAVRARLAAMTSEPPHEPERADPVYQHDPDAPGDEDFEPGDARPPDRWQPCPHARSPPHAGDGDRRGPVAGRVRARGRRLRGRRARWRLPVEDVSRFQFGRGSRRLGAEEVQELEQLVARLARRLKIPVAPEDRERTLQDLGRERERLRPELFAGRPCARSSSRAAYGAARARPSPPRLWRSLCRPTASRASSGP